jgi:hypothetical protein
MLDIEVWPKHRKEKQLKLSPLTGFHTVETGDPEDSSKSPLKRAVLS